MTKNRVLLIVASLLIIIFIAGCGEEKPKIGIVDKKRITQESIYYQQIQALDEQIAEFEKNLAAKKIEAQKQLQQKEDEINKEMQETWQARVRAREQQLNEEFIARHKGFFDEKENEFRDFVVVLEKETNDQIDSYMTELQKPETTEARASEIAKEIENTKKQATERVEAKNNQIKQEVDARLAGDRSAMEATISEYAVNVREELFASYKKDMDAFAEGLLGDEQKEQNELKEKQNALVKTADEHIRATIKTIAESKKIDTVFVEYLAHIEAVDITDDVLKKMQEEGPKQPAASTTSG